MKQYCVGEKLSKIVVIEDVSIGTINVKQQNIETGVSPVGCWARVIVRENREVEDKEGKDRRENQKSTILLFFALISQLYLSFSILDETFWVEGMMDCL